MEIFDILNLNGYLFVQTLMSQTTLLPVLHMVKIRDSKSRTNMTYTTHPYYAALMLLDIGYAIYFKGPF